MRWRDTLYLLASAVPPVVACVFVFAFAFAQFQLAWACAFVSILAAETRAQMGPRVQRTTLFWMHLCSAIPFFLALTVVAFVTHSLWLVILTAIIAVIAFYTGSILWHRGLKQRMLHLQ